MDMIDALIESWRRQTGIVDSLANLVDDSVKHAKPSEDGWSIAFHLCHIHEVRYFWLSRVSKEHASKLGDLIWMKDGQMESTDDLELIRKELKNSATQVAEAVKEQLAQGLNPVGGYDNALLFLQHMMWHEGWHVGLIMLALRLAGREPGEEWEEPNVWGQWRVE